MENGKVSSFTIKNWIRFNKFTSVAKSDITTRKLKNLKAALLALLFGIVLGIIIIYLNGYNGFAFLGEVFIRAFDNEQIGRSMPTFQNTINYFTAFVVLALGLAVGFKVGIFNIGGSGQAILGAGLSIYFLGQITKKELGDLPAGETLSQLNPNFIILAFVLFVFSSTFISALAGVLKVYLNIHEVVTTVMFNWAGWYFIKWLLNTPSWKETFPAVAGTQSVMLDSTWIQWGGNPWIAGVVFASIAVSVVFILLRFTTFGYKFKIVANSVDAAKYAGVKSKGFLIVAASISGLLIGIGAFLYYFSIGKNINFKSDSIPDFGFDGISISLVAFNNEFGIIPIALLWAVLKNGSSLAIAAPQFQGLTEEAASLMFGAIIYGTAIFVLFLKFEPLKWIKIWIFKTKDFDLKKMIMVRCKEISLYKEKINTLKESENIKEKKLDILNLSNKLSTLNKDTDEYKNIKQELKIKQQEYKFEYLNQKSIYRGRIKIIKNEIKNEINKQYKKYFLNGTKGLITKKNTLIEELRLSTMDELIFVSNKQREKVELLKEKYEKSFYEIKKSDLPKEEIDSKISILRDEYNEQIKTYQSVVDDQKMESIISFNSKKEELKKQYNEKILASKKQEKAIYEKYKNILSNINDNKSVDLYLRDSFVEKTNRWHELMEVDK